MKTSFVMTVADREAEVLLSTLRSLARSEASQEEIVIVNDGSALDYSWIEAYAKPRFSEMRWVNLPEYEAFRIPGTNYNNPARAFNAGVLAASGERLVLMSSDVLATPRAVKGAMKWKLESGPWTPRVIDLDSEMEYCGPNRVFPMPWFLACSKEAVMRVGGWDEGYLVGLCFEDNDFVGRLTLDHGGFACDWTKVAYHQSHPQPAYAIGDEEVRLANERGKRLTMEKWGGVPFDSGLTPFDVTREMDPSGLFVHKCAAEPGKLEKAVEMTTGMVKEAAWAAKSSTLS